MIAVEIFAPANRVVQKRWPQVQVVTDVRDITQDVVHQWLLQFPMVEEIHLWAGFPCTDLSRVRAFRQGLQGPASSLVFETGFWEPSACQTCHRERLIDGQVRVRRGVANLSHMALRIGPCRLCTYAASPLHTMQ